MHFSPFSHQRVFCCKRVRDEDDDNKKSEEYMKEWLVVRWWKHRLTLGVELHIYMISEVTQKCEIFELLVFVLVMR